MASQINTNRIIAQDLTSEIYRYLVQKYDRSGIQTLTPASPFNQILNSVSELTELNFLYIENAISELNSKTAKNTENIFGLAALVGHVPYRGLSARGKISLRLKVDYENFDGDYMLIPKNTKIKSLLNGLTYIMLMDEDYLKLYKTDSTQHDIIIVEGELETQTFTSTGQKLQSLSVITKSLTDHFNVSVYVNGEKYGEAVSLYDMSPGDKKCIIRTGLTGGIDIFFGDGNFGYIPESGALIEITYLKTVGQLGNITSKENDTFFKFDDSGITMFAEEVDLNKIVTLTTIMSPTFGASEENVDFTRLIAPYMSKNFVLVSPENYYYYLKKYNYFSVIDVYNTTNDKYKDDDNIVYMFLIPDINKKIGTSFDYFTIDESEFYLNPNEKDMVIRLINESGQQLIGTEISFVDPIIKRYVVNVVVTYYEGSSKDKIESDIIKKLNDYFLNIKRRDIIPKADLISLIKKISGIDSVNIYFISEENEKAILNGFYTKMIFQFDPITGKREWSSTEQIIVPSGTDPGLGLNEFGDIKIEQADLPIIRGGWYDRNNRFYEVDLSANLSGINIYFKNQVPYTIIVQESESNFKNMLNT